MGFIKQVTGYVEARVKEGIEETLHLEAEDTGSGFKWTKAWTVGHDLKKTYLGPYKPWDSPDYVDVTDDFDNCVHLDLQPLPDAYKAPERRGRHHW